MSLRVVVADDNFLIRAGLQRLLPHDANLEVVAECADYEELIDTVGRERPDVVLTDIRMPPNHTDEGVRAAEHIRRILPDCGVVLLSQYVEPAYVDALLAEGTQGRGYLLKERVADLDEIALALRRVAEGGSAIDPEVVEALVHTRARTGPGLARLTPRKTEVLKTIAAGKTNAAVADTLFLSRKAAEKHINSIFFKLDLTGDQDTHPRVRAVLLYLSERPPEP